MDTSFCENIATRLVFAQGITYYGSIELIVVHTVNIVFQLVCIWGAHIVVYGNDKIH